MNITPEEQRKIAVMEGVREHTEHLPIELWRNGSGRLVIRSFNESGYNYTDVDLLDVIQWSAQFVKKGAVIK